MIVKRNKASSDAGVMSILKVSEEKFHMKQSNGQLIPSPIGIDTSAQGMSNTLYKI